MGIFKGNDHEERRKAAAEARLAMAQRFKAKVAEEDPEAAARRAERDAIVAARNARRAEKEAAQRAERERLAAEKAAREAEARRIEEERLAAEAAEREAREAAEREKLEAKRAREAARDALRGKDVKDIRFAMRKARK